MPRYTDVRLWFNPANGKKTGLVKVPVRLPSRERIDQFLTATAQFGYRAKIKRIENRLVFTPHPDGTVITHSRPKLRLGETMEDVHWQVNLPRPIAEALFAENGYRYASGKENHFVFDYATDGDSLTVLLDTKRCGYLSDNPPQMPTQVIEAIEEPAGIQDDAVSVRFDNALAKGLADNFGFDVGTANKVSAYAGDFLLAKFTQTAD